MTIPWWLLSDFCLFVAAFIIGRWAGRWEGRDEMPGQNQETPGAKRPR